MVGLTTISAHTLPSVRQLDARHPSIVRLIRAVVTALLPALAVSGCGGGDTGSSLGGVLSAHSDAGPKSIVALRGLAPPVPSSSTRTQSCETFKVTSEAQVAASYSAMRRELQKPATGNAADQAARQKLRAGLDQPHLARSIAISSCSKDGTVSITGFDASDGAEAFVPRPYATNENPDGWRRRAVSQSLGDQAKCFDHEEAIFAISKNQDCVVVVGRYLLQVTEHQYDNPSVAEEPLDTIARTEAVKAWFEAGPK